MLPILFIPIALARKLSTRTAVSISILLFCGIRCQFRLQAAKQAFYRTSYQFSSLPFTAHFALQKKGPPRCVLPIRVTRDFLRVLCAFFSICARFVIDERGVAVYSISRRSQTLWHFLMYKTDTAAIFASIQLPGKSLAAFFLSSKKLIAKKLVTSSSSVYPSK